MIFLMLLRMIMREQFCEKFPSILKDMCSHCSGDAPTLGATPDTACYLVGINGDLVYAPLSDPQPFFPDKSPSVPIYHTPRNERLIPSRYGTNDHEANREREGRRPRQIRKSYGAPVRVIMRDGVYVK